jgi:3-oxoacyl-[acyl-carrier protein] reductase
MKKRNVLITGASKGIGLSTAKHFIECDQENVQLYLVARNNRDNEQRFEKLSKEYPDAKINFLYADLSKPKDITGVIDYFVENEVNVDVLLNNAGYTNPTGFKDIDIDDLRYTFEVNLFSPFLLIQGLFKNGIHIKKVVNIASTAGMGARPGWLSYAASKAAMINMSDTLREELAVFNTDVICISPGRCATDLRKKLAPNEDPETIMQPQDVAKTVYYLTSESGCFIDSHNIVVRL